MNLKSEVLGTKVTPTKWRMSKGGKAGVLEFALAPEVQGVEAELVRLLVQSGGKEKHGAEAKGPASRKVDEAIEDAWELVSR